MLGKPDISFRKAAFRILISIVIVSGLPWMAFFVYSRLWQMRAHDHQYEIVAIIQTAHSTDHLKTDFLAELVQLSQNRRTNLYQFDLAEAEMRLQNFPLIQKAEIKRVPPGILSIDYTVRTPVAFIKDFSNTVIDKEGYVFPFYPFFSSRELPVFVLGLKKGEAKWGERLSSDSLDLAFAILSAVEGFRQNPLQIDVSSCNALSLGDQKAVVRLRGKAGAEDILLDPVEYEEGLFRYKALKKVDPSFSSLMIDLRLKQLGYFF